MTSPQSGWTVSLRGAAWPRKLAMPLAAAIALSLPAAPVHALSLGEIEVSSSLGQPLRARVPVSLRAGEELSADCISVVRTDPFGGDAAGLLASARVELRKLAGKSLLLVSSSQPVEEPVARLLLRVSCSDGGSIYREYTLLLDPPQYQMARAEPLGARGQPLRLPQAPPPPNQYTQQIFSGISEYTVKEGDTLDSIVKNRYPGSPRLQRRLRQAIATANSDVLPSVTSPLPEAGTPLLIPELPPLPIAQAKPRIKPKRLVQRPPEPIAPEAAAPPPPTARARQAAPAASVASGRQPEFVLRLSRSALDTNRPITEDERASLRERQRLLDADDLTASMLSLQHEMRQMKAEIETLKTQLRQQQGGTGAPGVSAAQAPAAQPAEPPRQSGAAAPKWYEQWTPLAQRWWWVLPALALGALLLAMVRRRRSATYADAFENAMPATTTFTQAPTLAPTQAPLTTATRAAAQQVEAGHAKRELDVQARYLADRFPELADAGVDLADTEAVVEQSRVYFMEDGAADKAIELLEYTTSKYPEQPKPWLALLEIYRQMKMKGAFEKQAIVFRDRFRDVAQWKKVCAIGRTIDPNNALYAQPADEVPAEAAAVEDAPLARLEAEQVRTQNWLDIPLDFTPALRGENLRSELLSELPEDRPEPKVPEQMGGQTVDFDLDADAEQVQKERVEPRLVRKPSQ